jgi:hypothetical protein
MFTIFGIINGKTDLSKIFKIIDYSTHYGNKI